jgi:hypothetical protein
MFSSTTIALLPAGMKELVVRRVSHAVSRGCISTGSQQRRGITISQLDNGKDGKLLSVLGDVVRWVVDRPEKLMLN